MKYGFDKDEHRTMHFKTTGKIVYDPIRAGKVSNEKGWCIIEVDVGQMLDYYSFQFHKKFGFRLDKPSWLPHLSVLVGEGSFSSEKPWGWRDGEVVDVSYSHYLFWNDNHIWVAANCDAVVEIREHYSAKAGDRGHITIGRIPKSHFGAIPAFTSFKDLDAWKNFIFNTPLI